MTEIFFEFIWVAKINDNVALYKWKEEERNVTIKRSW